MEKNNQRAVKKQMRSQAARRGGKVPPVAALAAAAAGGAAVTIALLSIFALVYERTALPLDWIRPLACLAAAAGAFTAGLILAGLIKQQKLLCGVACGAIFAVCLALATLVSGNTPVLTGSNLALLLMLLAAGATGGAVSALINPAAGAAVR